MGTEFKIGDKIVIKTWDEMEAEFGTNEAGSIACRCSFTENMAHYCGEVGIIKNIYNCNKHSSKVEIKFYRDDLNAEAERKWTFSTDMIKHFIVSKENWIEDMYRRFSEDKNCFYLLESPFTVIVNGVTRKSAVAKCSPNDDFNLRCGCAIAYARLIGEGIPNFDKYKELGNVGLFDKFKCDGSTYGIIGTNPKTKEIYVYDTSTGNTNHYKPNTIVEVIK